VSPDSEINCESGEMNLSPKEIFVAQQIGNEDGVENPLPMKQSSKIPLPVCRLAKRLKHSVAKDSKYNIPSPPELAKNADDHTRPCD